MGPVIFLTIYESICVVLFLYLMIGANYETSQFAAQLLHIALRISAIIFLFVGYKEFKKIKQFDQGVYYTEGENPKSSILGH